MSKVPDSSKEFKATTQGFNNEVRAMMDKHKNPLSVLTDRKPLSYWGCILAEMVWKAEKKIKPGMTTTKRVHDELVFLLGMQEILRALEQMPGAVDAMLDHMEMLRDYMGKYKELADKALDARDEMHEEQQADGPADLRFLSPTAIAIRLQRSSLSN